ncbi:hypothetical protein L4Z64_001422 [Pseudomonas aeruginosa]|nr:hypothetical protein [Pseudomonas aeruginosa]MBX6653634.1 hypothetical protein [Pseudomonas aeruginosa]
MDFKLKALTALLFIAPMSSPISAWATGIPVFCYNCQEASHNAAHSIMDAIRAQTEALLNAQDYVMRNNQTIEMVAEQQRQRTQNERDMNVGLGAKPRPACGQSAAAAIRGAANAAAVKTRSILGQASNSYNMRSKGLAPGESRKEYSIQQVIEKMDEPTFDAGKIIMEREPLDPTDTKAFQEHIQNALMITNPFPAELPSQEEVERIKKSGSQGEREALAQALAMSKRQQVAQYVVIKDIEANTKRIDPNGLKYMLEDIMPFLSDEEKAKLNGKISSNQLNELLATYRVRSPLWVKNLTTSASALGVQKELALQGAEILNQLYMLNTNIIELSKINSMSEARGASQGGMVTR